MDISISDFCHGMTLAALDLLPCPHRQPLLLFFSFFPASRLMPLFTIVTPAYSRARKLTPLAGTKTQEIDCVFPYRFLRQVQPLAVIVITR